jgi:hypothetical protein
MYNSVLSCTRNDASGWIYTDIKPQDVAKHNAKGVPPGHKNVAKPKKQKKNLAFDQSPFTISSYPPSSGRAYVAALIPTAVSASKLQLTVQRIQEVSSFQPVKNLSL